MAGGITLSLLVSENDPHITISHPITVGSNADQGCKLAVA